MKKTLLTVFASLLLLSACNPIRYCYQVYEVNSPEVKVDGDVIYFENSDCRITYNLWSDGGNLNFIMKNKTNKNIYLVMSKSFFILNDIANDYYTDSSHSLAITNSLVASSAAQASISGYINNRLAWYPTTISRQISASVGTSKTETFKYHESPIICIPPQSSKFIQGFNLSDYVYLDCQNRDANYPKYTSPKITYDDGNSPLVFRNIVCYSFDEKGENVETIENHFNVFSMQNFSEKAALSKKKVINCESGLNEKKTYFDISAPYKFYNKYSYVIR